MGIELNRRAARHAALAEPVRLRIVDLLALSDRTPGDLRARLQVSSNLLAHHLHVLDTEGILTRTRSEGDGRRSYVSLIPGALSGLTPVPALQPEREPAPRRVLFVCTGNSARSPMAAAMWAAASSIPAASAGTRPAHRPAPKAVQAARRRGMDLSRHRPRPISEIMTDTDRVITLCDRAYEHLGRSDVVHWSVPNPGLSSADDAYHRAFATIAERIDVVVSDNPNLTFGSVPTTT